MYYVRMFAFLLILNATDIVAGLISAIRAQDIKSTKLRDGLFKKMGFIFCYLLAFMIDEHADAIGIAINVPICPALAAYVFFTEMVSIIENIALINPTLVPGKLLEMFHVKHVEK